MSNPNLECFDPAEDCPWCSPREILARLGYTPFPPAELDDHQLPCRLWELLYAAAARRFFFHERTQAFLLAGHAVVNIETSASVMAAQTESQLRSSRLR